MTYVAPGASPILIMQGTADETVLPAQAENLYHALKKAGDDATLIEVAGAGHGIGDAESLGRVQAFFDKYLRGQKVIVSDATIKLPAKK
jgi:dipeptidyl aminopeptidase/acylaminoacyl peptidase